MKGVGRVSGVCQDRLCSIDNEANGFPDGEGGEVCEYQVCVRTGDAVLTTMPMVLQMEDEGGVGDGRLPDVLSGQVTIDNDANGVPDGEGGDH